MSLDVSGIISAVQSHAQKLGIFDRVGTNEPRNAPGTGLTCAIWADQITTMAAASGLGAAALRIVMMVRLYTPMLSPPYDQIDPQMMAAVDTLLSAYAGSFTLDGEVRNVDLFGQAGLPLSARAGYLTQDGQLMRVMDISLPLIVNDVWGESP